MNQFSDERVLRFNQSKDAEWAKIETEQREEGEDGTIAMLNKMRADCDAKSAKSLEEMEQLETM